MQLQFKTTTATLMVVFLIGCDPGPTGAIDGSKPAPGSSPPFDKVVLRDVQGLWGGQDLWLYANGRIVVQVVKSPTGENGLLRYETIATAAELRTVQTLLDQHHFSTLKIPQRRATPDESHPKIDVDFKTAQSVSVMKWADDKNADFDPIYDQLLTLAKRAATGTPVYEGRYDWDWIPEVSSTHPDSEYSAHVQRLKETLPADFTILIQKPFVVAGDGDPQQVQLVAAKTIRWTVEYLKKDYFDKEPADLIDIYLFKDKASYDKYTRELFHDTPTTPYGYYSPAHKALIMNIATGGGTLVHEIVHPFMAANFPADSGGCPTWFNEGLASLYEQCTEKEGHLWGLPNWRLTDLKETLTHTGPPDEGDAPDFKTLCAMPAAEFYGPHKGPNYGVARYLCLYLQEKGVLLQFYKDFVKNHKDDPTGYATLQKTLAGIGEKDMDAFRKKWEAWVLSLKCP